MITSKRFEAIAYKSSECPIYQHYSVFLLEKRFDFVCTTKSESAQLRKRFLGKSEKIGVTTNDAFCAASTLKAR